MSDMKAVGSKWFFTPNVAGNEGTAYKPGIATIVEHVADAPLSEGTPARHYVVTSEEWKGVQLYANDASLRSV